MARSVGRVWLAGRDGNTSNIGRTCYGGLGSSVHGSLGTPHPPPFFYFFRDTAHCPFTCKHSSTVYLLKMLAKISLHKSISLTHGFVGRSFQAGVACVNGGRVLEVGFGLGISAKYIDGSTSAVTEHVIIEANAEIAAAARLFAETARVKTVVVEGFWQDAVKDGLSLEAQSFDGVSIILWFFLFSMSMRRPWLYALCVNYCYIYLDI